LKMAYPMRNWRMYRTRPEKYASIQIPQHIFKSPPGSELDVADIEWTLVPEGALADRSHLAAAWWSFLFWWRSLVRPPAGGLRC
jgi:hypothetical protein